ncbi:MAG: asparagine synthase-related protein, partial [Thermoplasmata archaeon]|nr:asparagine synthase-related protein [Thermoplasmata archaeon]
QGFNILLSGGLDSSVVAAAAASVTKNIRTVCVGTRESVDLRMARKAETFDYPLVRSCIPNLIATRMFSDKRRPTLCGEGGDEVFAGYDFLMDVKNDEQLAKERKALLKDGHMTGFQRVDRMTASASLDGRMPLMSQDIIDYGLSLGRKDLLGGSPEKNKLVLRRAYARLLPREVIWRRKQRFSDGAGSMNALVKFAEDIISDKEFEKERKAGPRGRIRTKEELLYYRIFSQHFQSKSASRAVGYTSRP